jgi:hypothetical protein
MTIVIGGFFYIVSVICGILLFLAVQSGTLDESKLPPLVIFGAIFFFSQIISLFGYKRDHKLVGWLMVGISLALVAAGFFQIVQCLLDGVQPRDVMPLAVAGYLFVTLGIFTSVGASKMSAKKEKPSE